MSYNEELWGHFYSMDKDGDKFLDSGEMLDYLNRNKTNGRSNPLRQLCLDALVEEGDTNWDWRLSFQEYKEILSENFVPSAKCKLNDLHCIEFSPFAHTSYCSVQFKWSDV